MIQLILFYSSLGASHVAQHLHSAYFTLFHKYITARRQWNTHFAGVVQHEMLPSEEQEKMKEGRKTLMRCRARFLEKLWELTAVDLAAQKGASGWLTVLPIGDMDFDLNKSEFWDALKLRYDWEVPAWDALCLCLRGHVDHAMICKRVMFVI